MSLIKLSFLALLWSCLAACSDDADAIPNTSTNLKELAKFINLETYKPVKAEWIYAQQGDETRLPGPTDYKLQAVLKFDKKTVEKLKSDYLLLSVTFQELQKERYRFEWLDDTHLNQLNKNDMLFSYKPNFFMKGSLMHGEYTIIDETTVLVYLFTM